MLIMVDNIFLKKYYLYFKACFSGDTEDADDYESAESEAACSDDEPLDDDEEDTKLPGSTSR